MTIEEFLADFKKAAPLFTWETSDGTLRGTVGGDEYRHCPLAAIRYMRLKFNMGAADLSIAPQTALFIMYVADNRDSYTGIPEGLALRKQMLSICGLEKS